jgi:3-hydroxyacyl-[acyl-carrier-protein] dehydratase
MRWYWIDRFIEFESGRYAKAVKNVTATEGCLQDHFPGYPLLPNTLVMEGLAQTGGLLVFEHSRFAENPILAKVPTVRFHGDVLPGDRLTYTAAIEEVRENGALVSATSHNGDRLQAEMVMMFAHFHCAHPAGRLSDPRIFLDMMRILGAFEVAHAADGSRLVEPTSPAEALVAAGTPGAAPSDGTAPRRRLVPR